MKLGIKIKILTINTIPRVAHQRPSDESGRHSNCIQSYGPNCAIILFNLPLE